MPSVTLDPIGPEHADAVQRLASDPDVVATTNLPEPYPDDGAEQWIDYVRPRHEAGDELAFAILKDDGPLVGVVGLVDVTGETAELGFWIGKPFWGNGYATEAAREAVRVAFDDVGVDRVFARPLQRNDASRRVLEKLGFEKGPVETHEHPKWTDDDPVVRYTLSADAYANGMTKE